MTPTAGRSRATGGRRASDGESEPLEIAVPGGSLVVATTPYAPFFGEDELTLLRTIAALTGIALDRVRLFEQERESRLALERANEVMSNFVTLAAHELRTPVTTIHGFVHTLNHLGDRLDPARREEVSLTLEQQTQRMILLVEQLLDLSRLDAESIDIVPQPLEVRDRLDELVATVAASRVDEVEVSADETLVAELDAAAFDRIVSNLVANALRYGAAPVRVRAEQNDRHFRLTVEDGGEGVPAEFVPDLFERFSRSDASRSRANGTGLGLAIARSYARAHGGDLVYEPGEPRGARFAVVLPAARPPVAARGGGPSRRARACAGGRCRRGARRPARSSRRRAGRGRRRRGRAASASAGVGRDEGRASARFAQDPARRRGSRRARSSRRR